MSSRNVNPTVDAALRSLAQLDSLLPDRSDFSRKLEIDAETSVMNAVSPEQNSAMSPVPETEILQLDRTKNMITQRDQEFTEVGSGIFSESDYSTISDDQMVQSPRSNYSQQHNKYGPMGNYHYSPRSEYNIQSSNQYLYRSPVSPTNSFSYGFGEEPNHQMDMMNFKPIKNMNPPYAFNNMVNQKPFSPIKQTKPKNPIKKPMNAFMIYMKDTREKVSKEYTVKESALVNQILAKKWNEMSEEDRKPFFEKAKEAKRLHQEKYASMEVNSNGSNLIEKRPNSTQKDSPLPGIVVQDFSPYLSNQNFGGKRIMQHGRGYYNTSFAPDFRFGAVSNLTHQPKLKNKVKAQCSVDCINTIGISDPDSWCDICKSRRRKLKYAKILKEHDSKKN